jgi:hypothetical protein
MSTAPLNASQVGSTIFGMLSGMFAALSNTVITTAVKATVLIDKSLNVAINTVSAAENVTVAVEQRSKIYGDGIVRNGELAERETTLKYKLRLKNLEKQEASNAGTKHEPKVDTIKPAQVKVTSAVEKPVAPPVA